MCVFVFCVCVRMCESVYLFFFWCEIKLLSAWVLCSQTHKHAQIHIFWFCLLFSSARQIKLNSHRTSLSVAVSPCKMSTKTHSPIHRIQAHTHTHIHAQHGISFRKSLLGLIPKMLFPLRFSEPKSNFYLNVAFVR